MREDDDEDDAAQLKEKLLKTQAEFHSSRPQAAAAAPAAHGAGLGDWRNYQPPSAVLQAAQAAAATQAAATQVAAAQPSVAQAAATQPATKDLPPAMKARLMARGILKEGAPTATASGSAAGAALASEPSCSAASSSGSRTRTLFWPCRLLPRVCRPAAARLVPGDRPHLQHSLFLQPSNRRTHLD